jgi:hypothetical protein
VLVPEQFNTTTDEQGDVFIYPQGDMSVGPSGHMPKSGYFFDAIVRQEDVDLDNLNAADNCEEFTLMGEEDIAHWEREIERLRGSDRAVVGAIGGTGFGDIALVPAAFLKAPKGIRDISEWYMILLEDPDYVHEIFTYQCDIALQNLETFAKIGGDVVDVLMVCGTDFGTQNSQFCSTDTFDSLYAPYYRRINDWVHAHTKWRTFKHSCGAVRPLVNHFIACGFDILNPVQCSATGMEPNPLKADFGDRIAFWGGGVDTQKTLPFGTPEEVSAEVTSRLEAFSPGGGFIFNTIHNIQARTPIPNIVAMVDAIKAFNASR